ncbi:MAG: glycosyl hydrolase family 28-related protein [Prosthecobacter sp.]
MKLTNHPQCLCLLLAFVARMLTCLPLPGQAAGVVATQLGTVWYPASVPGVINVVTEGGVPVNNSAVDASVAINALLATYNRTNRGPIGSTAIVFATWTLYFPNGTYTIKKPLIAPDCAVRIVGQSRDGVIFKVPAGTFPLGATGSPWNASKYVIKTGNSQDHSGTPNSGFGNYIQNLTLNIESNNDLSGIRFDVANCGTLENVKIIGGAGSRSGLVLHSNCGVGLVKHLVVTGFKYGIEVEDSQTVDNMVLEHITLTNPSNAGVLNLSKNLQFRDLQYSGQGPAFICDSGSAAIFLVASTLTRNPTTPLGGVSYAITSTSTSKPFVYLRNSSAPGYRASSGFTPFANFPIYPTSPNEYCSHTSAYTAGNGTPLNLGVEETPLYNNTFPGDWWNVLDGNPNDSNTPTPRSVPSSADGGTVDDTPGIYRAIVRTTSTTNPKTVLYFPRGDYYLGTDLHIYNAGTTKLRKIDFLFSFIHGPGKIIIHGIGNSDNLLVLENMAMYSDIQFLGDEKTDKLVIRNHGGSGDIIAGIGAGYSGSDFAGRIYIESGGANMEVRATKMQLWARALNREMDGFTNDGGKAWVFGQNVEDMWRVHSPTNFYDDEYDVRPMETINGGLTEIIGGALDPFWWIHAVADGPLITCDETSRISATYAGMYHKGPAIYPDADNYRQHTAEYGMFPFQISDFRPSPTVVVPFHVMDQDLNENVNVKHFTNTGGVMRYFVPPYVSNP